MCYMSKLISFPFDLFFSSYKEDYASTNSVENTSPGVQLFTDFREILGLALVLVAVGLQAALDVHQAALLKVFLADLAQPTPGLYVDPFGVFLGLTFGLPAVTHRQAEGGHLFPSRCEAALRILSQASDQLYSIQGGHIYPP
jgi:hypothetical protein